MCSGLINMLDINGDANSKTASNIADKCVMIMIISDASLLHKAVS